MTVLLHWGAWSETISCLAYLHSVEVLQHKVPDLRAPLKKKKLETIGCNSQLLPGLRATYVGGGGGGKWGGGRRKGRGGGGRGSREDEGHYRKREGKEERLRMEGEGRVVRVVQTKQ